MEAFRSFSDGLPNSARNLNLVTSVIFLLPTTMVVIKIFTLVYNLNIRGDEQRRYPERRSTEWSTRSAEGRSHFLAASRCVSCSRLWPTFFFVIVGSGQISFCSTGKVVNKSRNPSEASAGLNKKMDIFLKSFVFQMLVFNNVLLLKIKLLVGVPHL